MESEKEGLAKFMKHSSRIQAKYYDLSQQGIRASRTSNLLTKMVLGQDITEADLKKETQCMYITIHIVLDNCFSILKFFGCFSIKIWNVPFIDSVPCDLVIFFHLNVGNTIFKL